MIFLFMQKQHITEQQKTARQHYNSEIYQLEHGLVIQDLGLCFAFWTSRSSSCSSWSEMG